MEEFRDDDASSILGIRQRHSARARRRIRNDDFLRLDPLQTFWVHGHIKPMARVHLTARTALSLAALTAICACGRAAEHGLADQRLTALLSGEADTISLDAMFPGAHVNFVCVVDEFVSGSNVLANLRRTRRVGDLQYDSVKDEVPEDMFGLLLIEDQRAELHLIDRRDVRFGVVETQCFTNEAVFRRGANGFWETDAPSFQTHLPPAQ